MQSSLEELKSANEELQTVNTELQSKVDDLSWVNNDMENLLKSTGIATVFLDKGLRVRRFTNHASLLFKLIQSDLKRSLSDIVTDLQKDAKEVFASLRRKKITYNNERWFKAHIMPYRTQENVIIGVVLTFTDISEAKLFEAEFRKTRTNL